MTSYVENETEVSFSFDVKEVADSVIETILEQEGCPYEVQINLLLTDNEGIRTYNAQFREIDRATDVLSFPNVDYEEPADFSDLEEQEADYFDPDSGELILGDIIISVDKVKGGKKESLLFWLPTVCSIFADMTIWRKRKQR